MYHGCSARVRRSHFSETFGAQVARASARWLEGLLSAVAALTGSFKANKTIRRWKWGRSVLFIFQGFPGIFVTTVADKAISGHVASRQHRRLMLGIC